MVAASLADVLPRFRVRDAWLFAAVVLTFTYLFVITAWIVDDAYITFRTIDNLLSGYGLTWNVGERVQAYTHPLWMFLLSGFIAITGEYFYTTLAVSYLACVAALGTAYLALRPDGIWKPLIFTVLFLTSKSVIDYSSSGLENPLGYLFAVVFCAIYLRDPAPFDLGRDRRTAWLILLATLSYLNRQDTVLLYLPALMHVTWQSWKVHRSRAVLTIVIVATPALAWTLFSTWYYGFPFPNTAAAKMTIAELGLGRRVDRGAVYYMLSLRWDALGFVAILVALFFAAFTGARRSLLGLLGVVIYLAYVLVTASAATHMAGRFFAIPFVLAFYVTAHLLVTRETGAAILFMGMAYSCVNPVASWKLNTSWYQTLTRSQGGYIDTLWFAHREASGLLKPEGGIVNVCLEDGKRFGATPERLQLGGCGGGDPIGFFAFAAGPDKWIVDPLGLPDPLLARLQPCVDFRTDQWRPGHFRREVPDGYLESIRSADNHIKDAGVREYYGILRNIVSGPLWSPARLKSIVLLNLGVYNRLLDPYNRAVVARARSGQCRF